MSNLVEIFWSRIWPVLLQVLLAGVAAGLTYISEHIATWDFGDYQLVVMTIWRGLMTFAATFIPGLKPKGK